MNALKEPAGWQRTLRNWALLTAAAAVAMIAVLIWWNERSATSAGFSNSAEYHRARIAGISDPNAWKQKLEEDERQKKLAAEAAIKAREEEIRAELAKRREARVNVIRTLADTHVKTDIKFETLNSAKAAIEIYDNFDSAIRDLSNDQPSPSEQKLIDSAKRKSRQLKSATYPRIRKAFEKFAAQKLWVDDYEVSVSGLKSENIRFKHHSFALNRNVQGAHDAMALTLREFRFKQACYSSASQGWCYKIDSYDDGF